MPTAAIVYYNVSGIGSVTRVELVLQPKLALNRTILVLRELQMHNTGYRVFG